MLEMVVLFSMRQQSGVDPRPIMMLSFISATVFGNKGNTAKGSTPHMCQVQQVDAGRQGLKGQIIGPKLRGTRQRSEKQLTTRLHPNLCAICMQ